MILTIKNLNPAFGHGLKNLDDRDGLPTSTSSRFASERARRRSARSRGWLGRPFLFSGPANFKTMASRLAQVKFHIRSDDYFSTLATILDLTRQTMGAEMRKGKKIFSPETKKIFAKSDAQLERLKNELMFLQDNYQIVEK